MRVKYGVDEDVCNGDHACIRLSGCPTLTIKDNPDPLKVDPVATVIDGCVGCGLCGANAHAATLCPSFYRAEVVQNPRWHERAARCRARRDAARAGAGVRINPPRCAFGASPPGGAASGPAKPVPRRPLGCGGVMFRGWRFGAWEKRDERRRPITLLICALGGEGGGVLAEWLVDTATLAGYAAQSTSIPGVAQRTGATTYYLEVFPQPQAALGGRRPVFSLNPVPGALDALVSSELLETARQVRWA